MIIFPPIQPAAVPAKQTATTKKGIVATTVAIDQPQETLSDRRLKRDRRSKRGSKQVMDRRSGPTRRRSSIDLSV